MTPRPLPVRLISHWGLLLFGAIGLFGYVMKSVGWFSEVPGNLGDARFNSVVLEHLYLWTRGLTDGLWDPAFFYPFDNTLAFSDNHFGSGIVYVVSRYLGMDRVTAFQVWFVTGNLLNVVSSYYVLKQLGFSTFAAGLGAFVFAFALPVLPKEGHAQLVYRFASPLALFALWQGLQKANPVWLGVCALWTAWQFYCSIYLGYFLSLLLAGVLLGAVATGGLAWPRSTAKAFRTAGWRAWAIGGALAAASALLILGLLQVYAATGAAYGMQRGFPAVSTMLPRIQSYFLADYSTLWRGVSGKFGDGLPMRREHQMFLGVGVIGLTVTGALFSVRGAGRNHLARACAVALLFMAGLTLITRFGTLYALLAQVPGILSIRAVARIIVIMVLPVALLCALAADEVRRRAATGRTLAAAATVSVLAALAVTETLSFIPETAPASLWRERQAELEARLPDTLGPDSVLFVTDVKGDDPVSYLTELDAVIVAQALHIPTLNGYSGNIPPGYVRPGPCTGPDRRLARAAPYLREEVDSLEDVLRRTQTVRLAPCEAEPPSP